MTALEIRAKPIGLPEGGAVKLAQAPEPLGARNDDWDKYYSDSDRYELSDVFDEDVYRFIADRITKRTRWARIKITISIASLVLAILSLVLVLLHVHAPLAVAAVATPIGLYALYRIAGGGLRGLVIVGTSFAVWLAGSLVWVYLIYPRLQERKPSSN